MDIKVEIQPKEIIANVLTPVEPIYGGTKNYENLENLPSINGIQIIGNLTLDKLGIQPQGDYAKRSELPQNVSDLNNDAGYLLQSDLTDYAKLENLPTKVSELENDSDYATKSDLPTKTSELENDSDFAYVSDIPTNVSELNNDSNYLVRSDISNLDNHVIDTDNPHKVLKSQVGLGNVDNTSDADKPLSIAQKKYIDDSYANSNAYTDQKIADLIGGAPETLDTLKEVSDAIAESKDVETALNNAIGTKANQTELDTHTRNDTIHITSSERTNWNDANSKKHTHSNKSVIDKITQTLLDNWNAAYNHISDTVKHITSDERNSWNNKYSKPTNGIPKSDLASAVQTSLGKADTALQAHQDISGKMDKANPTGTGSFSLNRKVSTTVGTNSFAEGTDTTASGYSSHAENGYTTASGGSSHAEGVGSTASGGGSHAEGYYTIANGDYQHVQGKYNVADTTSAFIIGNGSHPTARSNAMKVDWNGNLEVAGDLKDGSENTLNGLKTALDSYICLDTERLSGFNISTTGRVSVDSTFDLVVAKVKPGMKITASTDVYAFFTVKPTTNGGTSYNNSRTVSSIDNVTVPNDVLYVAYRIGKGADIPKLKTTNIATTLSKAELNCYTLLNGDATITSTARTLMLYGGRKFDSYPGYITFIFKPSSDSIARSMGCIPLNIFKNLATFMGCVYVNNTTSWVKVTYKSDTTVEVSSGVDGTLYLYALTLTTN